jgi:hypothetical protein
MLALCFLFDIDYRDTHAIVFGMNIEEAGLLNAVSSRILGKTGDVDDTETGCIVGLVGETIKSLRTR